MVSGLQEIMLLPFGLRTEGQHIKFKFRTTKEKGLKVLENSLFKRLHPDIKVYLCKNGKYIFYGCINKSREIELKTLIKGSR
jgi:hypothetical protein